MEFDSLFTAVQGIMRSFQGTTTVPFAKVNKDNDIVSKNIIESLHRLITELSLKDEQKRRINLLLIVNTNLPSIPTLEDDCNFWHLLGCLPNMSPYLLMEIVSNLKFHTFVGEALRLCPEYLSIELFQACKDHFKHLNYEIAIPHLQSIYEGIFFKIVKLQKENRPPAVIRKFVTELKDAISFNAMDLIKPLILTSEKKHIFFGYYTQMLLDLLTKCISKTKSVCDANNIGVYDFNVDYDYSKWDECTAEIHWINHSLSLVLKKCFDAVQAISVDTYLSWCEEDVKGCIDKTLQTTVRETAYHCRQELQSIFDLSDEIGFIKNLDSSLSNIALQPVTEDDEIKKADAETIVMNLLNPKKTQTKWLKGLIQVPGIFQSGTYMRVINDKAHLFDLDVAKVLLDTLLDFLDTSQCPREISDEAKELFFSCLKKQQLPLQVDLLSYYLDKKLSSNLLQRENFNDDLIAALNKISASDDNQSEMTFKFVGFCFENAELMTERLLEECLNSQIKADILLELVARIPPLGRVQVGGPHSSLSLTIRTTVHLLDSVLSSLDNKHDQFIQLVKKLCLLGLIEGNVFFPQHVLPRFQKRVEDNDLQQIIFYLDVLEVYCVVLSKAPSKHIVPLLAFLGKLLDNIRPGVSNFSMDKITATSKLVTLIRELVKIFINTIKEEEETVSWLKKQCVEMKESTRCHFELLWSQFGCEVPSLPLWLTLGFGLGECLTTASPDTRRDTVTTIVKVLPTLTLQEWQLLGGLDTANENLLLPIVEAVIDAILVSIQVPFLLKNLHIVSNLLNNFTEFMWRSVLPKVKMISGKRKEKLTERLTYLVEVLPADLRESKSQQVQLIINSMKKAAH